MSCLVLGIVEPITRVVAEERQATPTPIVSAAIPIALAGRAISFCSANELSFLRAIEKLVRCAITRESVRTESGRIVLRFRSDDSAAGESDPVIAAAFGAPLWRSKGSGSISDKGWT
jgi:hypothetical protein